MEGRAPAWLREVHSTLGVCSSFVLEGNVRDNVLCSLPGSTEAGLVDNPEKVLQAWLEADGYQFVLAVGPSVGGLELRFLRPVTAGSDEARALALANEFVASIGRPEGGAGAERGGELLSGIQISFDRLAELVTAISTASNPQDRVRCALICSEASRLVRSPENLDEREHALFSVAQMAAINASALFIEGTREVALFNPVFWLVQNERDLPDWFLSSGERVRTITVPMPTQDERNQAAALLLEAFQDYREADADLKDEYARLFANLSEGMTLESMTATVQIALDKNLQVSRIEDAVRAFRVGVTDNPWRQSALRDAIEEHSDDLGKRVLGQEHAIRQSLEIIIRSITGMTAAHGSPNATKPRGVLFFAGPTGVGKTELAKSLTRLIFGNERSYLRFDMSEFSEEHNAARLIGAPPGYTGFDAGGELTNSIREQPFSLVLFDEIEKAHGRILDKFLQILDDGRLTDGRGGTVFFTEAIIVFTSNLGVVQTEFDEVGNPIGRKTVVHPDTPREEAERTIRSGIERYFKEELGRPELLNRIGDNIVVFDFITEEVGQRILDLLIGNVAARVQSEHGVDLQLTDEAREQLGAIALADLSQGGRGIGSRIEQTLVNPLALVLFSAELTEGSTLTISGFDPSNLDGELRYEVR